MRAAAVLFAIATVLAVAVPSASANQCGTNWTLELPATASLGDTVDVDLIGAPDEMAFLMVSLTTGSTESKYGTICVGFPIAFGVMLDLDENGVGQFSSDIPCDTSLVGVTAYLQFITCSPNKGSSNLASITIADGLCDGDVITFPQDSYAGECNGEGGGGNCRLEDWFDLLFPNGIVLGDQDGIDGDDEYAVVFTSAAAVESFLPKSADAHPLLKDATDPSETYGGRLTAELLAAKITVALDNAGLLDDVKARPDVKIAQLIFVADVNPDLFGLDVQTVIDVGDQLLSGALGEGDVDIDGDGDADATAADLAAALNALNTTFNDGTVGSGSLRIK